MRMPGQRKTEMISLIVGTMAVVVIIIGLIAAIEMILVIVYKLSTVFFEGRFIKASREIGRASCRERV